MEKLIRCRDLQGGEIWVCVKLGSDILGLRDNWEGLCKTLPDLWSVEILTDLTAYSEDHILSYLYEHMKEDPSEYIDDMGGAIPYPESLTTEEGGPKLHSTTLHVVRRGVFWTFSAKYHEFPYESVLVKWEDISGEEQ